MAMNINYYIETTYQNDPFWFTQEVEKSHHTIRVSRDIGHKQYLHGNHKVNLRKDLKYKDQEFIVKKMKFDLAKTILNFHTNYLLGKPITLTGSESLVKEIQQVYKYGGFNDIDAGLLKKNVIYGEGYEYIYRDDNGNITSKIIDTMFCYPVFADDGTYVAFIEHWKTNENIYYWNVYYPDRIEEWTNEGANPSIEKDKKTKKDKINYDVQLLAKYDNESSLPIPYYEASEWDYREGEGLLEIIIPVIDELEDLYSKMGDAIYTLSLNPLLTTIGQSIEGGISNDAVGYNVSLDNGSDLKYVTAMMDYNTIKLLIDNINNNLNLVAHIPSILGGSGNIANVSEVSLKMLYQLADVYAGITERIMRRGFNQRLNIIRKMIGREDKEEYVDVEFNYARPSNATEILDNIKKQVEMGAMSIESAVEKSPLTTDKTMELERLAKDKKGKTDTTVTDANSVVTV